MKTFNQFLDKSYLSEMRKEDKVKGEKKTPLYQTLSKKHITKDDEGKWKVKKSEKKALSMKAAMGRMKQAMDNPTNPYSRGTERIPGTRRHLHGGGGSGAREEGLARGKKKVKGEKKERAWNDAPTPAQKVKAKRDTADKTNRSYYGGGSRRMYEGYDKPDEKLKTDRDMFNVPKDEQDSAKARLLAKAKKMREKKKLTEGSEAKSCPDGKYWCFDDEKCKKIPKGYSIGRGGYLSREDDDDEVNDMGDGGGDGGGLGESNIQEIAPIALGALALKGLGAGLAGYSAYSAGKNLQKGNYGAAALDALGAIPGVGIFGKGAKVAKTAKAARAARNAGRVNSVSKAARTGKNANKAKKITGVKRNVLGNVASNALNNITNNSGSDNSSSKKYGASAKDMDAPNSKDALEKYRKMLAKKKQETNVDENYNHSNWRDDFSALEVESFDIIKAEPLTPSKGIGSDMLGEKCWPGYTKKGMKTMFGKRYPNCVKKKSK